jgi:hypothetical protein
VVLVAATLPADLSAALLRVAEIARRAELDLFVLRVVDAGNHDVPLTAHDLTASCCAAIAGTVDLCSQLVQGRIARYQIVARVGHFPQETAAVVQSLGACLIVIPDCIPDADTTAHRLMAETAAGVLVVRSPRQQADLGLSSSTRLS